MPHHFDLESFLPYQLVVLSGQISSEFAKVYQEQFGLSRAEWRVMAHLSQDDAVSVREIHRRIDMDKSKISRAASRLEQIGIVSKRVSEADRRLVVLALTERGQEVMTALADAARGYQKELERRLAGAKPEFEKAMAQLVRDRDV